MQKIIICNRFAYPDQSATSQLLSDVAISLASEGHRVAIITSRSLYNKKSHKLPRYEKWQKVSIHRVWSTIFGGSSLVGKALDYISFYASLSFRIYFFIGKNDILIAKTDPPLLSVICALIARHRGAHLVNWLQDIYPEVAIVAGVIPRWPGLLHALQLLRDWSLKNASINVVISESMSSRLRYLGVKAETIHKIPNWIDEEKVFGVSPEHNPFRSSLGLREKFVVGYSGNLGRAHDYMTVVGAAKLMQLNDCICFAVIGGGRAQARLRQRVAEEGVERMFRFLPYQAQTDLHMSLSIPDVHWISLQPEYEGMIFPSKFYGIAAVGRPIIAITGQNGELAQIIRSSECGFVVAPGDSATFCESVLLLSRNANLKEKQGANARLMVERDFSRKQAHSAWRRVIKSLSTRAT